MKKTSGDSERIYDYQPKVRIRILVVYYEGDCALDGPEVDT